MGVTIINHLREQIMPKRGDKLYKCWNGQLEVVTFVEESIADGAFAPTWVVREKGQAMGRRLRCSIGSYFLTEKEAWQAELANYKNGLKSQIKQRDKLEATIKETLQMMRQLREKVESNYGNVAALKAK